MLSSDIIKAFYGVKNALLEKTY